MMSIETKKECCQISIIQISKILSGHWFTQQIIQRNREQVGLKAKNSEKQRAGWFESQEFRETQVGLKARGSQARTYLALDLTYWTNPFGILTVTLLGLTINHSTEL